LTSNDQNESADLYEFIFACLRWYIMSVREVHKFAS
jgi:hypothetical protein